MVGAPAGDTKSPNPAMVQRALDEMQASLPAEMMPSAELFKVVLDKVTAEERMKTMLKEYQLQWEKATKMVSKAQSKMKESSGQRSSGAEGYGATTSPTRSTASWEQVQASPERKIENPMDYLTDVEKEQIRRTVEARMLAQGVATSLSDNEVELEPDYRSSSMQ